MFQRINTTNATSRLDSGTLADALAERDVLKLRGAAYRELAAAAATTQARTAIHNPHNLTAVEERQAVLTVAQASRAFRVLSPLRETESWLVSFGRR